jgi:hypothetical protein
VCNNAHFIVIEDSLEYGVSPLALESFFMRTHPHPSGNTSNNLFKTVQYALIGFLWMLLAMPNAIAEAAAKDSSRIHYHITFLPEEQAADVRIDIDQAQWLKQASFSLRRHQLSQLQATGTLEQTDKAVIWQPNTEGRAHFQYRIPIGKQRTSGGYDAYITQDWTLLRGEALIPPISVKRGKKVDTQISVSFTLPPTWSSVTNGWTMTSDKNRFDVNKTRESVSFTRLYGWIIAGQLGTRHEQLLKTLVTVSAPRGQDFRQMEMLTFLAMVWPHLDNLFPKMPDRLLITGAGDPMWRGGLSAPTSLYLHSQRPLVGEDGTSTLIHELIHVISGIHGKDNHDWIAEGLAEYYAVELIYRAGGFSAGRREKIFQGLIARSQNVKTLKVAQSKGDVTARAAVFFDELDREIQKNTKGRFRLDQLLQRVWETKYLDLNDLQQHYRALTGMESALLRSSLVK